MTASTWKSMTTSTSTRVPSPHPEVLWAQRSDKLYLTVSLPDAKNVSVSYEFLWEQDAVSGDWQRHGRIIFSRDQHESYNFTLYLYGLIDPDGCKTKTSSSNIRCSIQKMERGWWKRLLESEEKPPYIKVDEDKWCDEDEESNSELISDDDDGQIAGEDEAKGK